MAKKKNSSYNNYLNHLKGKEPLANAILQHPDEPDSDKSMYSYIKGKVNRNIWIMPWKKFRKIGQPKKK